MKGYQKEQTSVKRRIELLDTELLMALASEGLLALFLQVGLEVFRQILDTNVEALAGVKGTPPIPGAWGSSAACATSRTADDAALRRRRLSGSEARFSTGQALQADSRPAIRSCQIDRNRKLVYTGNCLGKRFRDFSTLSFFTKFHDGLDRLFTIRAYDMQILVNLI